MDLILNCFFWIAKVKFSYDRISIGVSARAMSTTFQSTPEYLPRRRFVCRAWVLPTPWISCASHGLLVPTLQSGEELGCERLPFSVLYRKSFQKTRMLQRRILPHLACTRSGRWPEEGSSVGLNFHQECCWLYRIFQKWYVRFREKQDWFDAVNTEEQIRCCCPWQNIGSENKPIARTGWIREYLRGWKQGSMRMSREWRFVASGVTDLTTQETDYSVGVG